MLARLLVALLLAAFAVPVAATPACHDGAPMAAMHHAAPATPDEHGQPVHACIGCIPPGDWNAARLATPVPPARIETVGRIARLDLLAPLPPATPPPRAG